jgi:hypothetical protein
MSQDIDLEHFAHKNGKAKNTFMEQVNHFFLHLKTQKKKCKSSLGLEKMIILCFQMINQ